MSEVESVLVIGSGGREFALLDEAVRSGVENIYSSRGEDAVNIGIESVKNTGIGEKDTSVIVDFATQQKIDLVIIGPEAPLVNGVADALRSNGIAVFGPNKDGAQFEANKVVTHKFANKYGLPNPDNSHSFTPDQREDAKSHIRELGPENIYTKRVGLEGGKGAVGYCKEELDAALAEVDSVADKGEQLLIQGRLKGPEYSAMFMLDGKGNAVATALSRDHKSLFEGGKGPNTGGMGAFAPLLAEQATVSRRQEIEQIGLKTAEGLLQEGIDYRGVIYAGLMAESEDPNSPLKLLEFNVRFGDPETQVLLQSLGSRAIEYMHRAAQGAGEMDMSRLYTHVGQELVSLTVCLASPGYAQGEIRTGLPITVPDNLPKGVSIQFASAKILDGKPVSSGGRVLYVTKTAATLEEARSVYDVIGLENHGIAIGDNEQVYRWDIGLV